MTPHEYVMVTVKLETAELGLSAKEQMEKVKSKLGVSAPAIDEDYGVVPLGGPHGCVVMIEEKLAFKLQGEGNPHILGVFSNPKFEPFGSSGDDFSFGTPPKAKGPKGPGL